MIGLEIIKKYINIKVVTIYFSISALKHLILTLTLTLKKYSISNKLNWNLQL